MPKDLKVETRQDCECPTIDAVRVDGSEQSRGW